MPNRRSLPQLCSNATILALLIASFIHIHAQVSSAEPPVKVKSQAHAHNDYEHARPLVDALENGFGSIEADVFLVDGELLVAHDLHRTSKDRTLESLYLKPLFDRFEIHGNSIYPENTHIILLVDIKANGDQAYQKLHQQLENYAPMLSTVKDGKLTRKAVTVIVSGDRAWDAIAAANPRYVSIDGRLSDLDKKETATLVPLISDNWRNHFEWRGKGPFPDRERKKLLSIVEKAHKNGQQIRFWATPESEELWRELLNAQVDLIGTDDLERLRKFLSHQH